MTQFQPDLTRIYRALLEHDLPILAGEAAPVPMRELLEPELAAIAGLASRRRGGEVVALAEVARDSADPFDDARGRPDPGRADAYDGAAFAREYREQRLPKYLESRAK